MRTWPRDSISAHAFPEVWRHPLERRRVSLSIQLQQTCPVLEQRSRLLHLPKCVEYGWHIHCMPLRHSLCVSVGGQESFSCSLLVSYLGLSNFSTFTAPPVLGWTVGLDWGLVEAVGVWSAAWPGTVTASAAEANTIASEMRTLPRARSGEIMAASCTATA